jgi:hypothetical protein
MPANGPGHWLGQEPPPASAVGDQLIPAHSTGRRW